MDAEIAAMTDRDNNIPAALHRIQDIIAQANDHTHPSGQSQAGLQLAQVEVPWLVRTVERLIAAARANELRLADPNLADVANPPELAHRIGLKTTGT